MMFVSVDIRACMHACIHASRGRNSMTDMLALATSLMMFTSLSVTDNKIELIIPKTWLYLFVMIPRPLSHIQFICLIFIFFINKDAMM